MKKSKIVLIFVISVSVSFISPIIINFIFQCETFIGFFAAPWAPGDALAYVAGALSFIGTMFLGVVAWQQNTDLQKIEKNNFIAQNSCMALIEGIKLKSLHQNQVNFPYHSEPMVKSDVCLTSPMDYSSLVCEIQLKRLGNFPATVHVDSLILSIGADAKSVAIFTKCIDSTFSRIAISESIDAFNITILITPQEKRNILEIMTTQCQILLDIKFDLVTANFVATHIKCRANLDMFKDEISQDTPIVFKLANADSMCFWYGNTIMDEHDITFRYIENFD